MRSKPTPEEVKLFLEEVIEVCRKHELSISHEDGHGSFLVEKDYSSNYEWLLDARLVESDFED